MNHHQVKSWLSGVAGAALIATAAFAQGSAPQPQNRPAAAPQSQSQPQAQQDQSTEPASRSQQKSAAPADDKKAQSQSGQRPSGSAQKMQDRQSRDKAAQDDKSQKSQRSQAQQDRSGQDSKPSARTTGQGSTEQSRDSVRDSQMQGRDAATTRSQSAQPARDSGGAAAKLTTQQRTRISQSIARLDVGPVRNVNFSVAVGTTVPRSVRLHAVPSAIVDIYPRYRGYEFAIVEEEIVIIQPRTRRIVAVLPYGGGSAKAARASTRKSIRLSDRDRDTIRRTVITRETTGVAVPERQIVVGEPLPRSVVIERFPDTVYRQVPAIRSYHYVVHDRDIYVVDPRERRVIEVIE